MGDGTVVSNVEDPLGRGLFDLQHKLVNTTHPDSFRDDPLRTLRALRFVSTLGYDLSYHSRLQMQDHAAAVGGLNYQGNTSGTVLGEMSKLLMGDDVGKALRLMRDTGVMEYLFPELKPMIGFDQDSRYHDMTTDEHTFKALDAAAKAGASEWVRWALLFHDAGKPETAWVGEDGRKHYYAKEFKDTASAPIHNGVRQLRTEDHEVAGERIWRRFCKRANAPKGLRESVATLIREHMLTIQPKNMNVKVRRLRVKFGDELLHDLLMHRTCDLMGKGKISAADVRHVGAQEVARQIAAAAGVPASVKDLKISGHDVNQARDHIGGSYGLKGETIGEVLRGVLDEVVCQPDELRCSREWQISASDRLLRKIISSK